jgi:uncharacterized protein (TIGR02266 family)
MPATIKLVVPVKFSGGGLSMQTTSSRIGAEGMFIRSLVTPKEASRLALKISLPSSARPLDAVGIVSPNPEPSPEHGFWVQFHDLPDETRSFLDVLLRSKGLPGPGRPQRTAEKVVRPDQPEPKRTYERVPARLLVRWTSSRDFLSAYSQNISRGGIFIATDDPPQLREIIELSVALPDGLPPVKTRAEVVRRVTAAEARRTGGAAGAGLQFLDAGDDFRQRLDACIQAFSD